MSILMKFKVITEGEMMMKVRNIEIHDIVDTHAQKNVLCISLLTINCPIEF